MVSGASVRLLVQSQAQVRTQRGLLLFLNFPGLLTPPFPTVNLSPKCPSSECVLLELGDHSRWSRGTAWDCPLGSRIPAAALGTHFPSDLQRRSSVLWAPHLVGQPWLLLCPYLPWQGPGESSAGRTPGLRTACRDGHSASPWRHSGADCFVYQTFICPCGEWARVRWAV